MHTDQHQKISTTHLDRDAFLYVRQSSLRQVLENQESTKRQYALRERATALGWPIERIHVIDTDLGQSGAQSVGRDGFTELVSKVAMGDVGIVLGLEVSRLARNNADWHRLLELCALANTLILDEDGVYDPTQFNDRLLLGLKGAMSEAELHVLKARLQGGILNKARRGELEVPLPIGFLYRPDKVVEIDPDSEITGALHWVFETFRQTGSAMAVVKRFHVEKLQFPRRLRRGINKGQVLWGKLDHCRVLQILHNPRYAGAFVYGRTHTRRTPMNKTQVRSVPRDQWKVLIQNAHIGYIEWDEFERNQLTLQNNAGGFVTGRRGSLPREGAALLQGRVVCGLCGERMRVRYQRVSTTLAPYYQCSHESVRNAGQLCQSVRGTAIDKAIGVLLLDTLKAPAVDAAFAVESEITDRIEEAAMQRSKQLDRLRYQCDLAKRRFFGVDPDNRLVADSLEADWNEQLRCLDERQQEHEQQSQADHLLLADEAREQIQALVHDFPRVWNDKRTSNKERKRMVSLLIEDATLKLAAETVTVNVRFRGGRTTVLCVERPKLMSVIRKTKLEVVKALDELLTTCTDHQAADRLNDLGHRTWRGESFTAKKVSFVRRTYSLKGRYERLCERGYVTAKELANRLNVSNTTVYAWTRAGYIDRVRWADGTKSLFYLDPGTKIHKAQGGRQRDTPIITFNAASAEQEIV